MPDIAATPISRQADLWRLGDPTVRRCNSSRRRRQAHGRRKDALDVDRPVVNSSQRVPEADALGSRLSMMAKIDRQLYLLKEVEHKRRGILGR